MSRNRGNNMPPVDRRVRINLSNLLTIIGLMGTIVATTIAFSARLTAVETRQLKMDTTHTIVVEQGKSLVAIETNVQWIKEYMERQDRRGNKL